MAIIAAAEAFVKEELAGNDGSHDWWHIHRVRQMALLLAQEEGLPVRSIQSWACDNSRCADAMCSIAGQQARSGGAGGTAARCRGLEVLWQPHSPTRFCPGARLTRTLPWCMPLRGMFWLRAGGLSAATCLAALPDSQKAASVRLHLAESSPDQSKPDTRSDCRVCWTGSSTQQRRLQRCCRPWQELGSRRS